MQEASQGPSSSLNIFQMSNLAFKLSVLLRALAVAVANIKGVEKLISEWPLSFENFAAAKQWARVFCEKYGFSFVKHHGATPSATRSLVLSVVVSDAHNTGTFVFTSQPGSKDLRFRQKEETTITTDAEERGMFLGLIY